MVSWKRDFASGLVILLPLLVTLFVLFWIYNRLVGVPIPISSGPIRALLTIVVFVLVVFGVGYLMRTAFGAVVESTIDDLMNRLPGLRVVYNASKMAVETALSGTDTLQSPVRLEVWGGLRMTAFKTGETTKDGREILFLPTAPNITTGFVIEVEPERYTETGEQIEDALTRLLSAGFGQSGDTSVAEMFNREERRPGSTAAVDLTEETDDDVGGDSAGSSPD